jgi:hypothetical protein
LAAPAKIEPTGASGYSKDLGKSAGADGIVSGIT